MLVRYTKHYGTYWPVWCTTKGWIRRPDVCARPGCLCESQDACHQRSICCLSCIGTSRLTGLGYLGRHLTLKLVERYSELRYCTHSLRWEKHRSSRRYFMLENCFRFFRFLARPSGHPGWQRSRDDVPQDGPAASQWCNQSTAPACAL